MFLNLSQRLDSYEVISVNSRRCGDQNGSAQDLNSDRAYTDSQRIPGEHCQLILTDIGLFSLNGTLVAFVGILSEFTILELF